MKRSKGLIVGISGLFGSRLCGSIGGIYDRDWDVRRFLPFSLSKKIQPPPFLRVLSRSVNVPSINGATTISQLWPVFVKSILSVICPFHFAAFLKIHVGEVQLWSRETIGQSRREGRTVETKVGRQTDDQMNGRTSAPSCRPSLFSTLRGSSSVLAFGMRRNGMDFVVSFTIASAFHCNSDRSIGRSTR